MRKNLFNQFSMTLSIIILCTSLLLFALSGCRDAGEQVFAGPAEHVDPRLVQANTAFAFNLFHALRKEEAGKNLFISPASVSMALAMTYNGAAGETAAAMSSVLGFREMSLEEINTASADLRTILENPDQKIELAIANSLWARKGKVFYEDFLQRNRDYYGAKVESLDFDLPDAVDTINEWVEQQTKGKIKDLLQPPINPYTVLFLINALYFKADWADPFDPKLTREIPFYLSGGSSRQHPVMFREGDFNGLIGEGFQAVSLPYGKTERLGMYIFLPDPDQTLDSFYEQLSPGRWSDWMKQFQEIEGYVGLPRFKFEYEASLNDALKALGMEVAFKEGAADFSAMKQVPPKLFIAEVKHKTFIEVNEKGTEAAAATSVEIREESAPAFNMIMDRPFFFAIVDNKTGSILFMGSVADPQL